MFHITPLHALAILAVGLCAGVINTVAGGGSILTFPTLIWLGLPPVLANATNAVGVWPGNMGSVWGFRRELRGIEPRWFWLAAAGAFGGVVGAGLLLWTPERSFAHLVPWLIFGATSLFAFEAPLRRLQGEHHLRGPISRGRWILAVLVQVAISIYGGYFGAGMGIAVLTMLGLLGMQDIHVNIGLKNIVAFSTNLTAVIWFILAHRVNWPVAMILAVGTTSGAWAGAHMARRTSPARIRATVVTLGLCMTLSLAWHWRHQHAAARRSPPSGAGFYAEPRLKHYIPLIRLERLGTAERRM